MNSLKNMILKLEKKIFLILLFSFTSTTFAQLSFCNGSSGAPIFLENFGSGTNYGPALPANVTNYTYVNSGFPQDGQYTLFYRTNLIPNNWLYSLDRTPDNEPDGLNGKCLIVNASNSPGQFYRRTVTGLCSNTRFEFSAWLLNIYNAASNSCPGSGIPINVTFEIWDETDTFLLQSGNTGNITGTAVANWNQFGLVFTMPAGQTSVILKMRNNGIGGCGNDLAIDDIMFRACGEYSAITNTTTGDNSMNICENTSITNPNIEVNTTGTITHVYQWQQSNDNANFTDIVGQNASNYTIPNITTTTYYRVKLAQDVSNLNNPFCSTLSDVYSVIFNSTPNPSVSNGNQTICFNQPTNLSVGVAANEGVDWYDSPTGGNLIQSNSTIYNPSSIGIYYAESYNYTTGCRSNTRTPVELLPATTLSYSGASTLCSGSSTAITLVASDSNATLNWTATSTDVIGISNGSGNNINQTLQYTGLTSGTVVYIVTPVLNGCEGIAETITVTVTPATNISLVFAPFTTTYCLNAIPESLPQFSSNTTPIAGTWNPSTVNTSVLGTTTYTFTPQLGPCESILPFEINITIGTNFSPNFEDTVSFCSGENPPLLLNTSPNGITGIWSPATINNLVEGSYTFTPNSGSGLCTVSQTINTIILEPSLTSITHFLSGTFTENQTITIVAFPSGSYYYQLDNGSFQEDAIFENVSGGSHTITVINQNGCGEAKSEEIFIMNYPNYFTPNGDGVNDYWTIVGINSFENWKISIFDRYGKLLTQLSATNLIWDGTYNGYKLPATDYWFVIDYQENNIKKTFKSNFSLLR